MEKYSGFSLYIKSSYTQVYTVYLVLFPLRIMNQIYYFNVKNMSKLHLFSTMHFPFILILVRKVNVSFVKGYKKDGG